MTQNQVIATGLGVSALLGLLGLVFEYNVNLSDAIYTLAGLGFYVFGLWAAWRLFTIK